jgi:hypothetical protein
MKFGCEKILMTSLVFDTINPLIPRITVGTCKMHTYWVLGFLELQFDPQSYNNTDFNQMYGLCISGTPFRSDVSTTRQCFERLPPVMGVKYFRF